MLKSRGAAEICARLCEMLAFFESLGQKVFRSTLTSLERDAFTVTVPKNLLPDPFKSIVPRKESG